MQNSDRKTNTILPRLSGITRTAIALGICGLVSACAQSPTEADLNPERQSMALREVAQKRARGQRVWCVPYARNLSGIEIRGNAKDWWGKAHNMFERGPEPVVGAVMSFRATGGMPLGHVAVVSDIVTDREVVVNHANWYRNRVSLKMGVKDVSKNNDWTLVRVESQPGRYGSSYPVNGFIYPNVDESPNPKSYRACREPAECATGDSRLGHEAQTLAFR
ncbi:CHAP domain-containing protein [Ruegeria hyattellae]|uniref:CHAP domain-containing protein n=1 Tax=Ruegeria hyattellae TaxID=3233337 RepID=UPI00355C461D